MRTRWFIITRRVHNRWLDLRGRLAGYCMATTWRPDTAYGPGYSPGYSHWRCWKKRHPPTVLHRYNNYVWSDDGLSEHAPQPIRTATEPQALPGSPPPWGKHHGIGTRRRDRLQARYAAAKRTQARREAAS